MVFKEVICLTFSRPEVGGCAGTEANWEPAVVNSSINVKGALQDVTLKRSLKCSISVVSVLTAHTASTAFCESTKSLGFKKVEVVESGNMMFSFTEVSILVVTNSEWFGEMLAIAPRRR